MKIAGKQSFLNVVRSLVRCNLWHNAESDESSRFRLQKKKRYVFLWCPRKMNPVNRVLRVFPRCLVMKVTIKYVFNFVSGGIQTVSN